MGEHEAETRTAERAHQAKIRESLVKKKEELESLSVPELKELCVAAGTKGQLSKPARVELLMKQWQEAEEAKEAEGGEEDQEQENEEEVLKRQEEEIIAARKKELKAMPVDELK